jgi:hypothetical protein
MPEIDIKCFSGEIKDYFTFINAFDTRLGPHLRYDADKLHFLLQHLNGEPRDLVDSCTLMAPGAGYSQARQLLQQEYGDPYRISMMYIDELTQWSTVKQPHELRKLSLYLTKCRNAMMSLSYLSVLDQPTHMVMVVNKLPNYLHNKWREQASSKRTRNGLLMSFSDLVDFIHAASNVANDSTVALCTEGLLSTTCLSKDRI